MTSRSDAGVQVILQVPDGRVLLQLRDDLPHIPFPNTWCIPGGMREPGESAVDCAVRELEEELGLVPTDLRPLHTFYANPGLSTWPVHLFFGTRVRAGIAHTADASEQVRLSRMPLAELDARIGEGEIVDPSLLIARTMAGVGGFLPPLAASDSAR